MYTATGRAEADEKTDLLTQYMPMVKRLAHHLMGRLPPSVEEDDMVQAGMMGLLDAISRFDEAQAGQFEAYAIQRIRGSMLDELRQSDWLPRSVRQSMRKIEKAMEGLQHQLGRQPKESEIAAALKISLTEYQAMLSDARGHQLLYFEDFGDSGEEDDSFLDKQPGDENSTPLPQLLDANLRACIVAGIEGLPHREKLLMSLYYEEGLNLREISEVFEVSEARVCQLHGQAIARIRAKLREDAWIVAA